MFLLTTESRIKIQILIDTTVEVIIKKINNRNITSVMDAILKLGDILALRFNAILIVISEQAH